MVKAVPLVGDREEIVATSVKQPPNIAKVLDEVRLMFDCMRRADGREGFIDDRKVAGWRDKMNERNFAGTPRIVACLFHQSVLIQDIEIEDFLAAEDRPIERSYFKNRLYVRERAKETTSRQWPWWR